MFGGDGFRNWGGSADQNASNRMRSWGYGNRGGGGGGWQGQMPQGQMPQGNPQQPAPQANPQATANTQPAQMQDWRSQFQNWMGQRPNFGSLAGGMPGADMQAQVQQWLASRPQTPMPQVANGPAPASFDPRNIGMLYRQRPMGWQNQQG